MPERWRTIARWAALGALSGTLATLAFFIPQWLGIYDDIEFELSFVGLDFSFSPLTIAPGLVFGLLVGLALRRAGLAPGGRYAAYIAAAGLSYFFSVQFTLTVLVDLLVNIMAVGVAAGAFGATLLAAATAALIPDFRRPLPMAAMILSGTILGAALFFAIGNERFLGWLLLFAPWQAGYAAAMATALPAGGASRRTSVRDGIDH